MIIRRFEEQDAQAVSRLIATTLRVTNARDYSPEEIETLAREMNPEEMCKRANWMHMYVACQENRIIGVGAIGPYWGKEDESSLFNIFVHPDVQGQGVVRKIVETLENDPFAQRARRIEIPPSITALRFYEKLGYHKKAGCQEPDEERLYRLEKFRD